MTTLAYACIYALLALCVSLIVAAIVRERQDGIERRQFPIRPEKGGTRAIDKTTDEA